MRLVDIRRGGDDRAAFGCSAGDEPPQLCTAHWVDPCCRLIEHEHRWAMKQRHRDSELPLHATRELPTEASPSFRQSNPFEHLGRSPGQRSSPQTIRTGGKGHVLVHGEVNVQTGGGGDIADLFLRRSPRSPAAQPDKSDDCA